MHYIVVAQSVDQGVPDQIEIFLYESEADGMFAGICSDYDLEEFPVSPDAPEKGLMRWATDGKYYSVSMYSRKIIV
jgi:hypothetical protein